MQIRSFGRPQQGKAHVVFHRNSHICLAGPRKYPTLGVHEHIEHKRRKSSSIEKRVSESPSPNWEPSSAFRSSDTFPTVPPNRLERLADEHNLDMYRKPFSIGKRESAQPNWGWALKRASRNADTSPLFLLNRPKH